MSPNLDRIKAPVADDIKAFEQTFRKALKSNTRLLDLVLQYLLKQKGKQIRPLFVFLTAAATGKITTSTHHAAALIELLHTATLVHDDVVDDSNQRRGLFSINALWKNKIAVLVGDYLLARGLLLAMENEEYALLKIVSEATRDMSEGELMQMEKARRLDIDEQIYFEIIRKKTASLIASCCACGATSSGANQDIIIKMKTFGEKTGIAFQIQDDLFDYQQNNSTGKPIGIDIREHKLTLPLIYTLNHCSYTEKKKIIHTVKKDGEKRKAVEEIIDLVNRYGGLEYAQNKMLEYRNQALSLLDDLPASPALDSLRELVVYSTHREN
ncbi:MAG TPA: polyprenyl synthetase family protein [Bacteroidales bacterium]|jgi:octaprenyl-diphosphate synthase|nr:polyprenyl synthetase family protein [Bacteroidales bacterium]HQN98056.1 polyprenyl synthetase family protein [Bacteroidales bacterium]